MDGARVVEAVEFGQVIESVLSSVDGLRSSRVLSGEAPDGQVEAALAAAEWLRRAADALALTVIGEIDRRGEQRGEDGVYRARRLPAGQVAEVAADVVAVATGTSIGQAGRRCDLAARLAADLPQLLDLLAVGRVAIAAVELVERETRGVSQETLAAVLAHLLAPVRGRPGSIRIADLQSREVARACRRVIARSEPQVLAERAGRNRAEAIGVRAEPGPVGTSQVTAILPSEVAAAVMAAIDAAGQVRLEDQPELTRGAARALGFADLLLRGVEVTAHVRLGIPVITSAASRLGFAPITGGRSGDHTDQAGGRHPFGRFCTCGADPAECPCFGPPDDAPFAPGDGGEPGQGRRARSGRVVTGTGADKVDVLTEEWHGPGLQTQAATSFGPEGPIGWISGATIPGIGYIPPDTVAALVTRLETRVSRALLDARTGTLLETSNPRYRIPEGLREFVTAREGTCRMFGCTRPVQTTRTGYGADLDHATPWPEGSTSPANLSALCRHHHRIKHSPRWSHHLHDDGSTTWTTPGGRTAFTFPDHTVHTDHRDHDERSVARQQRRPFAPPGVDPHTEAGRPRTTDPEPTPAPPF